MTIQKFQEIKENYGHYASWAIYSDTEIYDLSKFHDDDIHKQVNPTVVFLGLNVSGQELDTFSNFHGTKNSQYQSLRFAKRIREVFVNTQYYGGYMTDIIKDFEEPDMGFAI